MSDARKTIAILGSGDMGSAVAESLIDNGANVITSLDGRSEHSCQLARSAGMTDAGNLVDMLLQSDVLLSIIPPASATEFAAQVCPVLGKSDRNPLFVDCNAVAPQTVREIAEVSAVHQVRFQDVGIIGAAPRPGRPAVRFYTSGPFVDELEQLATNMIDVRPLGEDIGRASAIKMVFASMTKATHAVRAAAAIAGQKLGVGEEIRAEWQESLPDTWAAMQDRLPRLPGVSSRWIGEMHEIARTYESIGLTPAIHEGAAWIFSALADPAIRDSVRAADTVKDFVSVLDEHLASRCADDRQSHRRSPLERRR